MILIDSREKDDALSKYLKDAQETTLPSGDAMFVGNGPAGKPYRIGIERKRIMDFCSSLRSKHLAAQLAKMNEYFDVKYLVVEGIIRSNDAGEVEHAQYGKWKTVCVGERPLYYAGLINAINSQAVMNGVIAFMTGTPVETAKVITALFDWWTGKNFEDHKSHLDTRFKPHMIREQTQMEKVFCSVTGIGFELAKRLAILFPHLEIAFNAPLSLFCTVEGVGLKTAIDIFVFLHGRKPTPVERIL